MSWERVVDKFHWLSGPFADDTLRSEIISAVEGLDSIRITELTGLLGAVSPTPNRPRSRGRQ
jgi:2-methylcitrate dehydratase